METNYTISGTFSMKLSIPEQYQVQNISETFKNFLANSQLNGSISITTSIKP